MQLDQKRILIKWQQKNRGNRKLTDAIDQLILDLENSEFTSYIDLLKERKDADQVHNQGVFFLNIENDRVLLAIKFKENRAIVLWIGTHRDYEKIFRNNKTTIEKWLRSKGHIH
ncbi:type II toxin-antitoxin system HigB family toxin [Dyadobacter chenwenxiniae]|uniref:Type II toxin-antitoxin system HigB family toxin n=1 Tax=Dyadobacter chenwenxiniae TaxID=2906456 RepID=A0A9X1PJH2_9BACT|nr:type II toxin-antitoxin system HigB family toxin [Dyadobacter chenwenxiniae]MCF0061139.1 type II toxin-antitoxin system HigB family toxin [Dyadobacter chenwenxiniae]UON80966.1 type II toxin-antitoxin system HigB family toxin [Dyadobacter chenwenxiniae]